MLETYWPFWIGGPAIALVMILVLLVGGQYLAVTRGYASLCSIISSKSYFHKPEMGGKFGFRTMFTLGVVLGGLVAALTTGGYRASFDLGDFDIMWGNSLIVKGIVLGIGGFLWGYGSRMARGCTSGNAISGLARGSLASLVATCCFLAGGVVLTWILRFITGV